MKHIRKAVFPVAGLGTRFLPATKAMPKELLPIVDKPLIQYAAEEALAAGIDTLIFVTGRNKRAIEDHFDKNPELEQALKLKGQEKKAEMVRNIVPEGVSCIFVRQAEQLGLGHAVLCAEKAVGDEPFTVLLADDFVVPSKIGITSELIKNYQKSGKMQLSVMEVNGSEIENYGVIKPGDTKGSVVGLVEKPSLKTAPSNLASIGRYVLTPEIFNTLKNGKLGVLGEIQLADAISEKAKQGRVESVMLQGKRFDCGSVQGFLSAVNFMSQ